MRWRSSVDTKSWRAATYFGALVALGLFAGCGRRDAAKTRSIQTPLPMPAIKGLPQSGFQVAWGAVKHPGQLVAGKTVAFEVSFTNTGDQVWPDVPTSADPTTGGGAVRLSYRILKAGTGEVVRDYGERFDLKGPLSPSATAVLPLDVKLPRKPGRYEVQFDLVQEFVAWFEGKGAARNVSEILVVADR